MLFFHIDIDRKINCSMFLWLLLSYTTRKLIWLLWTGTFGAWFSGTIDQQLLIICIRTSLFRFHCSFFIFNHIIRRISSFKGHIEIYFEKQDNKVDIISHVKTIAQRLCVFLSCCLLMNARVVDYEIIFCILSPQKILVCKIALLLPAMNLFLSLFSMVFELFSW